MQKIKPLVCFFILACITACNHGEKTPEKTVLALGDKVDSLHGVYVYYNGSVGNVSGRHLAKDGYNYGLKYQCVEFVKRYYYLHYQHRMPDTYGNAKDFFDKNLKDGEINRRRNLAQFSNPSLKPPLPGDLLVMDATVGNVYGHVCIVSKVMNDRIEIIQQNPGAFAPSRTNFNLVKSNNQYLLANTKILGWLRKVNINGPASE